MAVECRRRTRRGSGLARGWCTAAVAAPDVRARRAIVSRLARAPAGRRNDGRPGRAHSRSRAAPGSSPSPTRRRSRRDSGSTWCDRRRCAPPRCDPARRARATCSGPGTGSADRRRGSRPPGLRAAARWSARPKPRAEATTTSATATVFIPVLHSMVGVRCLRRQCSPGPRPDVPPSRTLHGATMSRCRSSRRSWADSSTGRARPLQGRGRRFDPCSAHHIACLERPSR